MSCYVLSDQSLANLGESIASILNYDSKFLSTRGLESALKDCYNKRLQYYDEIKIANKLYEMNDRAVCERYDEEPTEKEVDMKGSQNLLNGNVYQFLKTLECYLYQCQEGDIDQTPLFKGLSELYTKTLKYIVHGLEEYEAADWR